MMHYAARCSDFGEVCLVGDADGGRTEPGKAAPPRRKPWNKFNMAKQTKKYTGWPISNRNYSHNLHNTDTEKVAWLFAVTYGAHVTIYIIQYIFYSYCRVILRTLNFLLDSNSFILIQLLYVQEVLSNFYSNSLYKNVQNFLETSFFLMTGSLIRV